MKKLDIIFPIVFFGSILTLLISALLGLYTITSIALVTFFGSAGIGSLSLIFSERLMASDAHGTALKFAVSFVTSFVLVFTAFWLLQIIGTTNYDYICDKYFQEWRLCMFSAMIITSTLIYQIGKRQKTKLISY